MEGLRRLIEGGDSGDTGTSRDGAGGLPRGEGLASGQAGIAHEEAIAMTAKQRSRSGRAMTAVRRAIGIRRSPARGQGCSAGFPESR
jgi:hypothetical protein